MVKRTISLGLHLLLSGSIIISTFLISFSFFIWSGYPKGGDAAQHLTRLVYLHNFPSSFNWFHVWAGGMPQFLWYPSFPYILMGLLMKFTHWSPFLALNFSAVGGTALTGVGVYIFIFSLTKKMSSALLGAIFFLATPASYLLIQASVYARQLTLPFLIFFLALFVAYLRAFLAGHFNKTIYLLTVVSLGIVLLNHFAMGATALGIAIFIALVTAGLNKKLIPVFVTTIVPGALLSSHFWLPFLFFRLPGFFAGSDVLSRSPVRNFWSYLFYIFDPKYSYFFEPNLFVLPFFLVGTVFVLTVILFLRRNKDMPSFDRRLAMGLFILVVLTVLYAMFPIKILASFYSNIWPLLWVFLFSGLFLSILAGFLTSIAFPKNLVRIPVVVFLILVALAWIQTQFPVSGLPSNPILKAPGYKIPYDNPYERLEENRDRIFYHEVARSIIPNDKQFNFRFGTGNLDFMTRWFNILYPFVPQTREYFYLSVLNPDSYFQMIQSIWNTADNYPQTNFLLDWWGVKQFIVGDEAELEKVPGKFSKHPEWYQPLGSFKYRGPIPLHYRYDAFQYIPSSPILSAAKTPSLLVIGQTKTAFNTIFQSLSFSNFNSNIVIPINGKEYVDDYSLAEIRNFPIVFLYNYKSHNPTNASSLLTDYVRGGGKLVIEENNDKNARIKPLNIAPVSETRREERDGEWQFDRKLPFSKAGYDSYPWAVMTGTSLKDGVNTILKTQGQPVIVSQKIGPGEVIWSGLNLPFHIQYYKNEVESQFLGALLGLNNKPVIPETGQEQDLSYTTPSYRAQFINPQERLISINTSGATGILFKEFYFPNWHASKSGVDLPIYVAGPGFMYIPISGPGEVKLTYRRSLIENFASFLSILTLIILVLYALEGRLIPPFTVMLLNHSHKKAREISHLAGSWWDKENE